MKALNRSYGVALVLTVLVCSFARCKLPGGPFVTVTIVGIPKESNKLVMTAVLGDKTRMVDTTPTVTQLQMTLNMPPESRGSLVVSAEASVKDTPCKLANGTVTVELVDDIAYEAILVMVDAPLDGCQNIPTINTVKLTLNKSEVGGSGSVVSTPAGIVCAAECTEQVAPFRPGTKVTLTARPAAGTQVNWLGGDGCKDSRVCTVTLTQATTVTATFKACTGPGWCDEGSPDVISTLNGVWGSSNDAVFAVGDGGRVLRRNAGLWTALTTNITTTLRTVGAESGSATPLVGGDNSTLLKLTGTQLTAATLTGIPGGKQISGITGESYGGVNLYLCTLDGDFYIKAGGGDWNPIKFANFVVKPLRGVSSTNGGAGREGNVVGDAGSALRWTDVAIFGQHTADSTAGSQTMAALRGVWSGDNVTVAVGDNGVIITRGTQDYGNGAVTWTNIPSPVTSQLNAVWGANKTNIWIVGNGGVILKLNTATMPKPTVTRESGVPEVDLNGVWAADVDPTHVYAVGRSGTILHYLKQ